MENEIFDIPVRAKICYEKNKGILLPEKVPYIGMGSSYFAALTLRLLGVNIFPELASEYFYYLKDIRSFENAVLISQSGRTEDVLRCCSCFKEYTAVVNNQDSPLVNQPNLKLLVSIEAGDEKFHSTKTFFNTLISLYVGHGFDVKNTLDSIEERFQEFELIGNSIGAQIVKRIGKKKARCFVLGSGPNYGIACQAALMLSESTGFPITGMSLSQYEHGYLETAEKAIVIVINPAKGKIFERTNNLMSQIRKFDAQVFEINDPDIDEIFSPFSSILPFYFLANYLVSHLASNWPFGGGGKIAE